MKQIKNIDPRGEVEIAGIVLGAGEVCSVPDDVAAHLVAAGTAEAVAAKPKKEN